MCFMRELNQGEEFKVGGLCKFQENRLVNLAWKYTILGGFDQIIIHKIRF